MTDEKSIPEDELTPEEEAAPEGAETMLAKTEDNEEAIEPQEETEDEEEARADTEDDSEADVEDETEAEDEAEDGAGDGAGDEAEAEEIEADEAEADETESPDGESVEAEEEESEESEGEEPEPEEVELEETEFEFSEEAEADVNDELAVEGEPEEGLEADAEKPEDASEEEPPHPDFEIFLDDETLQEWSYVPLLDLMDEPNIVKEQYVTHKPAKSAKPAPTPMERAKMLWVPAVVLVLLIFAVGAWNSFHTPLHNTKQALEKKYGMLTTCQISDTWYEPAMETADAAGNHPLEYGTIRVNGDEVYCIVNDAGDVLYDNYRTADFVMHSIPRSPYLLAAAVNPYYAACAVKGVPGSVDEYLKMAHEAIAEYADPIGLWPSPTGNGAVIFLSSAIPADQYEAYVEQCKGLALPTVRIMRVPADQWRDFQDEVAEWPDYYTTYGLVGLNVLSDNPLIYEGDENAFTHLEYMTDLVEEDIEIVPRTAAEE